MADSIDESVCIVDFCGRYNSVQFWAFWHPIRQVVTFGGDWFADKDIPAMRSAVCPTEEQVYAWTRSHGSPF